MPTIKDIAKAAKVSCSTVSYVLGSRSDTGRISEETRRLVSETAARLGYHKNRLASSIRSGKNSMIAVLGEVGEDGFSGNVASVLPGIVRAASEQGYGAQIYPAEDLERAINDILELRIGMVVGVTPFKKQRENLASLCRKHKLRLVLIYERGQGGFPTVSTDDRLGQRMTVDHLTAMGHERIAFFCVPHVHKYMEDRHKGYLDGLASAGITPREDFIIHVDGLSREVADPVIEPLLALPPRKRPTAFCCIGGLHAIPIMRVAGRLGLRVPEDLSIVTFGDSLDVRHAIVPLTTIVQPFEKFGGVAFDILCGRKPEFPPDKRGDYLLPPFLARRESSAPPPNS